MACRVSSLPLPYPQNTRNLPPKCQPCVRCSHRRARTFLRDRTAGLPANRLDAGTQLWPAGADTEWASPRASMPARDDAKELVKNKFPISCAFGNGAVVPLGQVIVKDDFHVLFEIGGVFAPGLVHLVQHPHRHPQAGRGLRTFNELPRDVHRVEDHPLAGARDVREHPVFDRIVLGTVRRIVGHTNLQPQPIGQPLEVFLEQVLRGAVAAATVAKHQQPCRLGIRRAARLLPPQRHAVATQFAGVVARIEVDVRVLVHQVIDPVGNQLPLARGAKVVVEGFHGLGGEGRASTVKIPQ